MNGVAAIDVEGEWPLSRVVAWNLVRLRRERGWSQAALGARLGVTRDRPWTQAQIWALEQCRRPLRVDTLERLADVFVVPVVELFTLPAGAVRPLWAAADASTTVLRLCTGDDLCAEIARRINLGRPVHKSTAATR